MKKITSIFTGLILATLISCTKEDNLQTPGEYDIPQMLTTLDSYGFKTNNIIVKEDHFELEDDVILPFDDLKRHEKYVDSLQSVKSAKASLFANGFWVTGHKAKDIRLYLDSKTINSRWNIAVREAIDEWNNISQNSGIHFRVVENFADRSMSVFLSDTYQTNKTIGKAALPCGGKIGMTITIYDSILTTAMNDSEKKNAVAHLLGHALGFGDSPSDIYPTIPGTNPNPIDAGSGVMSEENHAWNGFTADEKLAAEILYSKQPSDLQAYFSLPPNASIMSHTPGENQTKRVFIAAVGGEPQYEYIWKYRAIGGSEWKDLGSAYGGTPLNGVNSFYLRIPFVRYNTEFRATVKDKKGKEVNLYHYGFSDVDIDTELKINGADKANGGQNYTFSVDRTEKWEDLNVLQGSYTWLYSYDGKSWIPLPSSQSTDLSIEMPKDKDLYLALSVFVRKNANLVGLTAMKIVRNTNNK